MLTRRSILLGLAAGATAAALPPPVPAPAGPWKGRDITEWNFFEHPRGKLLATVTANDLVGAYVLVVDHEHQPVGLLQRLDVYERGLTGERLIGYEDPDGTLRSFSGEPAGVQEGHVKVGHLRVLTDRLRSEEGPGEMRFLIQRLDERDLAAFTLSLDDGTFDADELVRRCPVAEVLMKHPMYRPIEQLRGAGQLA